MRLWSFEESAPGKLPSGWAPMETNPDRTPAAWIVAGGADAQQGERYLRVKSSNSGSTFNLLASLDGYPADLELATWLRADSGEEDRGGGLIWRARDAANYWIARWNPMERNLRLYLVEDSKRRQIASADLEADEEAWHELRVVMRGDTATVLFDGRQLLQASDPSLPGGGRIGFWTKADASTSFDALTLAVATEGGPVPGPQPR